MRIVIVFYFYMSERAFDFQGWLEINRCQLNSGMTKGTGGIKSSWYLFFCANL